MDLSLKRVVRGATSPVEGYLRMLAAVGEDLAATVRSDDGRPGDPFLRRDTAYIERTLPTLRAMSKLYFRAEVNGLEKIPDGPVLLVGNHSGGTWIADTFVFTQSFYDHFGPERTLPPARP